MVKFSMRAENRLLSVFAGRILASVLTGFMLSPVSAQQAADIGHEMSDMQRDVLNVLVSATPSAPDVTTTNGLQDAQAVDSAALVHESADAVSVQQAFAGTGIVLTGDWAAIHDGAFFRSFEKDLTSAGLSLPDVQRVLADYQQQLIDRGYLLAKLAVKEAAGADGSESLEVNIDLGRYGDIYLYSIVLTPEGVPVRESFRERFFSASQIKRKLAAFSDDQPFNYSDFYRSLYDINMHPDLTLNSRLRLRQDEQRYIDMEMTVEERFPLHAILEVNNSGTESTKEWRAGLTVQHLNLLRLDDVVTLRGINATDFSSLNSLALSYRIPYHAGNGGTVSAFGGYSRIDSQEIVQDISIRGSGWFAGLQGAYRLLDASGHVLSIGLGGVYRSMEDQLIFDGTEGRKREAEAFPFSLSLSYASKRDDFLRGRNYLTLESVYNAGALMELSSDEAFNDLRQNAAEEYFVQRVQMARLQSLYFGSSPITTSKDWTLFIKFEGQVSDGALIPAEQFAVGGMNTVRGYDERVLLGDHGGVATMELRAPIFQDLVTRPFGKRDAEENTKRVIDRLQALVFLDAGFITRAEVLQGEDSTESISSAGLGLRWALSRYAQIRGDVGYRIDKLYDQDRGVGFHVSAQIQY